MTGPQNPAIVVTGFGLVSAAGSSAAALAASLDRRHHCLTPIASFDPSGLAASLAGQAADFRPLGTVAPLRAATVDRGTLLALEAARQALAQAELGAEAVLETGVAVGVSGSPQYQNLPVFPDRAYPGTRQGALYGARATPLFQADTLARRFGLGGPRFAFGSASLGGMLALSLAMDLLHAGDAPAMLVGGGEVHTLMNALGMGLLGITAAGACTPFAGDSGICFGEGAACFVLEREDLAQRRGAPVHGVLLACGLSADAYGEMSQDPAGQGLARAVTKCLSNAAAEPGAVGWIRACGTGQRDLDAAEAIGLDAAFAGMPPPVTSTEPFFSHVNGVSPLLGLAAVLVAQASGRAPAMPEPMATRHGLTVALLPPGPLPAGDCLLTATAFGGTNAALLVAGPRSGPRSPAPAAGGTIVIAGMGAVSPEGATLGALLHGLLAADPAAGPVRRVDDVRLPASLPGLKMQRRDRLMRMMLPAVAEALAMAGVQARGSQRVGLLVGLTRGPLAAYERFFARTQEGVFDITTGRHLLRTGRFAVTSEIAHAFGLHGYAGSMASGVNGGVHLLAHGAAVLRASADLDGLLVVAADEWTPLLDRLYRKLSLLGDGAAYAAAATGCAGGEGAAAVLLCRRMPGETAPGDWAAVTGSFAAGDITAVPDPQAGAYRRAVARAIERAGCGPDDVGFAVGQGCGWPVHDRRELAALRAVCPSTPVTSVLQRLGVAESAGGLFGAMAAAAALRDGVLPALPPSRPSPGDDGHVARGTVVTGDFRHGLVLGSTERGAHAAVVLSRLAA